MSTSLRKTLRKAAAPSAPISNRPLPPAPGSELARDVLKEGRVQCLVSGQWTDVFLVLRSGGGLDLFRGQEATGPKLDQLGLTLAHCAVSLQSSVSYNEVYHLNTTDRPYTFKLSVYTMGKLEKAVYFMCQNFSSKEDCINKLEVIKSSPANLAPVKTESSVSCLQLLVLATEQSQLVTLPTRPVISGSTSLEPQPVPDHSVLVGTSKFYEIDLKNFSAEEFLDLTNPGIQKSVATLEFKESAPHCVMDITTDTGEEKE